MIQDLPNSPPETGSFFQRDRNWHPPPFAPGYKSTVLRSPQRALVSLDNTLSEITGPVFGHSILGELDDDLIYNFAKHGESAIGSRIIVHGHVLDERGKPVPELLSKSGKPMQGDATATCAMATLLRLIPISVAADALSLEMMAIIFSALYSPAPIHGRTDPTTGGPRTSTSRSSVTASHSG